MAGMTREKADRRLDSIAGFREEQRKLEAMGLLSLSAKDKQAIKAYHDDVLADLSGENERGGAPVDAAHWGMRLAASFGLFVLLGLGFAGLDHLWPELGLASRIAILMGAPIAAIGCAALVRLRNGGSYYVALFCLLSVVLFALALGGLGWLFNRPPGMEIALFPGLLGVALGYHYDHRAPVFVGLVFLIFAVSGFIIQLDGSAMSALLFRLDVPFGIGLLVYGGAAFGHAIVTPHEKAWRAAGLLAMGVAIFGLAFTGTGMLSLMVDEAALIYRIAGPLIALTALIVGVVMRWRESLYGGLGLVFLVLTGAFLGHFGAMMTPVTKALLLLSLIALTVWACVSLWRFEQSRLGGRYA